MTATEDRWYVDVRMEGGTNGTEYAAWLYDRGTYVGKPVRGPREDCESFAALVNGPDTPAFVELHSDGTLWALGRNIPDGWERRPSGCVRWYPPSAVCTEAWYEVRRPQEPPTVRVPWWEALRDERVLPSGVLPITCRCTGFVGDRRWVGEGDAIGSYVDADGTVEVVQ